jgi:hypothetical protein
VRAMHAVVLVLVAQTHVRTEPPSAQQPASGGRQEADGCVGAAAHNIPLVRLSCSTGVCVSAQAASAPVSDGGRGGGVVRLVGTKVFVVLKRRRLSEARLITSAEAFYSSCPRHAGAGGPTRNESAQLPHAQTYERAATTRSVRAARGWTRLT